MARVPKKQKQSGGPPPLDRLLKPAAGVAVAMLAYYFMQGMTSDIPRIDMTDQLALREVLFGEGALGKDYAVLCHPEPKDGKPGLPVSSVFRDSGGDGAAPADYVLMDCDAILPESGKSVYDKFKINRKKRPTVFVSGKTGPPKQVPEKHLKTGGHLTRVLKQMLEPHAAKIEKTKELKEKCLNKEVCALLLKGGKPEPYVKHAVANLLGKYPAVQFASVDSTVLFLTNLEEYLPEYEVGVHRFVVFKKVSGGLAAGDNQTKAEGRLKTSILHLDGEGVSFGAMSSLISDTFNGKAMKPIPSLPAVKTRTKKLEASERQKRDRQKDRVRKRAEEEKKPPQTFAANDGSKEGRKLERERRRAEHNAEQGVKPKTPEEIAEMERKRRERMHEEAEKWNIAGEEGEEEGAEEGDEEEDEEGEGDEEGGDEEGDEDEDEIMDLD